MQLAARCDALMLKETHGSAEEMNEALHWFAEDWIMRSNRGSDRNVSGTVSMLKKEKMDAAAVVEPNHVVVPGRVSRVCVNSLGTTAVHWNEHNFGHPPNEMNKVKRMIEAIRRRQIQLPCAW